VNGAAASALGRLSLLSAVGLSGGAVMTVELAAVRLLAPDFGSSTSVWTNVIGVVLTALALGYALGARWSHAPGALARLRLVLVLAGLWILWLPFVAPMAGDLFRPERLDLASALPIVHWGSLATTALVLAPPIVALGTAGPLAVELVQRSGVVHAGTAGGYVLGASTLGSLVGTFATTHYLVPGIGLRATFVLAGAVLVAAALLLGLARRFVLLAGAAAALAGLLPTATPDVAPGTRLVDWLESPYGQVRVVAVDDAGATPLRFLEVGEVCDSYQSVWQPEPGLLPGNFYYNDFCAPLWWHESTEPRDVRVLIVGLGAGTAFRVLCGAAPAGTRVRAVGIEIDPGVVELARRHLDLDHPDLEVVAGHDARVALRGIEGQFDLVVVDAYANQFQVPEHLCSLEFMRELVARVAPGGWIVSNASGFDLDDPVVAALAGTLASAVGREVLALRVPGTRNVSLHARVGERGGPTPRDAGFLPADERIAALLGTRVVSGAWRLFPAAGEPLTDDHNPMHRLQLAALARALGLARAALP
jgi:predicted membrane-bound spermidine synthase